MSYIVLLISVFVLATVEGKPYDLDNGRIVGGKEVSIEDYPYQVSIQYANGHICGGSIISPTSVLTAAHCLITTLPSAYSIRVGSRDRTQGQLVGVKGIKENLDFNSETYDNDIAIFILNSRLSYGPTIQRIPLASKSPAANSIAYVSGWGVLEDGSYIAPTFLQAVDVKIVNWANCNANYFGSLTARMLCASAPGKDSCQGDSGGPLKSGGVLVGVVSWGYACADPHHPGVYTDVSKFRQWILDNMES